MEEIDFIYAAGKRINSVLVYTTSDRYLFTKNRASKGIVHYNCYTKQCGVKIQIQNGVCQRDTNAGSHSHPDNKKLYDQFRSEFLMKTRAQSNPDISIRAVVNEELGNDAAESPDSPYRRLRSSLYYNRTKKIPLNPRTFVGARLYVQNEYVTSLLSKMSVEQHIYHKVYSDEETVYIILAATDILEHLPDMRQALVTSCCRVVPPNHSFKLLLTISIIKVKEAFPCIFVLMTDRSASTYERVINEIESKWHLNLTKAWIDYERNLRNAIRNMYTDIDLKGFWFQFCIAVRRKCKTFDDFFENLWTNPSSSVLYHQYLCLPLLPQSEIGPAFQYLKGKPTSHEGFGQLNDFFEKVWMRRERPQNFAIEMDYFGQQCTVNINEFIKKKWHSPDTTHSFICLLKLLQAEIVESSDRFKSDEASKQFSTRQINFIKKQIAEFTTSETKDIPMCFAKLTFTDNNGSVKGWDNYTFGDDCDFADDDDNAYEIEIPEQLPEQVVEPEINSNETCVICLVNIKCIMLEPCNHLKFCRDCIDQLMLPQQKSNGENVVPKCPVCRTVITGFRVVYM